MIILIGGNKGGSGKTTLAVHLADAISKNGGDVCLVDADRQASAANWSIERESLKNKKQIVTIQKYGNIQPTITSLHEKYEYIVIDVAS